MVKFGLEVKMILENVEEIRGCGVDMRWFFKFKCTSCGEVCETWQYVCLAESVETKGGRGSASMVQKCKMCRRENNLDIVKESVKSYTADDAETFKCLVAFECRGLEPTDFDIRNGWIVICESNKTFDDVDLSEGEWYDYNDESDQSVSITEIQHRFVKLKK